MKLEVKKLDLFFLLKYIELKLPNLFTKTLMWPFSDEHSLAIMKHQSYA